MILLVPNSKAFQGFIELLEVSWCIQTERLCLSPVQDSIMVFCIYSIDENDEMEKVRSSAAFPWRTWHVHDDDAGQEMIHDLAVSFAS